MFVATELGDAIPDDLGALVSGLRGRCDTEVVAETRVCDEHVVENVGRVTDVGDCEGAERGKGTILDRRLGGIEQVCVFMQGEEVCQNLSGMPEGRQRVEDGDGRVFCEFLRYVCMGITNASWMSLPRFPRGHRRGQRCPDTCRREHGRCRGGTR